MTYLKYYSGVALIILLGAILRFFMLEDKSLWLDEGYSLYYSEGSIQEIISRLLGTDTGDRFQPLYYLLLYYWRHLFGNTEFAVRSLSAFLGVGAIIILYFTGKQLYGKRHAIWMALFLSLSSYGIYYSQQTRAYAMLLFLAALQMYFFSTALNPRQTKGELISRWLFWIVTALSLFCSVFIGVFTLSLCLSHILIYKNPKRWLYWWLPAALFSIPAILFYLASPVATEPTKVNVTLSRQPVIQNLVFVLYGLLVGETYGPPIEQLRTGNKFQILLTYLPQLLILTLAIGIFLFFFLRGWQLKNNQYQKLDNFFALLFIISLVVATLFAIVTKMNWLPRHSFYIYIPLSFLIPIVVRKTPGVTSKTQATFNYAQLAIIAILIINIYSAGNYYFNKDYQREDYRVVAQYLLANSSSVKSILLYGAPNLLRYYGDTQTLNGLSLDTSNLASQVRSITNDANKVLIAISFQDFWEFKKNFSLEKSMSNLYNLQSKVSFTNFNIYHYIKK